MIPVSLTIKGLYSYQQEQKIEFNRLLEGQLFGIFGAVGSGKSSILEAMSFALYGDTERLNKNDNRNYNMMNLKSDELLIDFIFLNYDEVEYRFTVRGKRNSKDFDKVNTLERKAYQRINTEWKPLESASAEAIIGLSYDNFRRTIIIPQGKFQEFLQLGDKARTDMLKEIFQLNKYEFFYQTTALEKKNKESIDGLLGLLSEFDSINQENIQEKQNDVQKLSEDLVAKKTVFEKLQIDLKVQEEYKKLFQELDYKNQELQNLLTEEQDYNQKEKKIRDYEDCLLKFKHDLDQQKKLRSDIEKRNATLADLLNQEIQNRAKLEALSKTMADLKVDYDRIDHLKHTLSDYETLIEIIKVETENRRLKERLQKGQEFVEKSQFTKIASEQKIIELKEKLKLKKNALPDLAELGIIKSWFVQKNNTLKNIKILTDELQNVEQKKMIVKSEFAELQKNNDLIPNDSQTLSEFTNKVLSYKSKNRLAQEELRNTIEHYKLQIKLGEFSQQLIDGENCPLCGSIHHPEILVVEDVQESINLANLQMKNLLEKEKECEILLGQLSDIKNNEQVLADQINALKLKITQEKHVLEQHILDFKWVGYHADQEDALEIAFDLAKNLQIEIKKEENELEALENDYQKAKDSFEKFQTEVEKIRNNISTQTTKEDLLKKQLKVISFDAFKNEDIAFLDNKILTLRQRIITLNDLFESTTKQVKELQDKEIAIRSDIRNNKETLLEFETQLIKITDNLNACLAESDFKSLEEIKLILNENFDIKILKEQVTAYRQQIFSLLQRISQLEKQVEGKVFTEEAFQILVNQFNAVKANLEEINKEYITQKADVERQINALQRKNLLLKDLEKLKIRAENLKTMNQLFKASGFVSYISSVYLQQLCASANERFYKLSRQQLKLEVTDKNEFQVRDYLNNGKVRTAKTLSGGQTFQASLSLALALAESVQQQNKSKQNFFFLDEGFGSLDKESLQIAFETLKSLRKENRIVGIISHVEELQQEIDVFLNVTNDPFEGSKISYSWR